MKRSSRSIAPFSAFSAVLLALMVFLPSDVIATEYSRAALLFLIISPSARVNGMGQAGVAIPDEPIGYYNPATPALCARELFASAVGYTERTQWLAGSGLSYTYWGMQIGVDLAALRAFLREGKAEKASERTGLPLERLKRDFSVGVALSRYRTKLDFGTHVTTGDGGNVIRSFHEADKAASTVISVNAHLLGDFSAGITFIDYESRQGGRVARGSARSYGIMIRSPFVRVFETWSGRNVRLGGCVRPVLASTCGLSWNNRGDDVVYIAEQPDPLPSNRRIGYSMEIGAVFDYEDTCLDLFRVLVASEKESTQIPDRATGKVRKSDVMDQIGIESECLETIVVRLGRYDDDAGEVHLLTSGITMKSDGLAKLLWAFARPGRKSAAQATLHFLARHLSISWHMGTYEGRGDRTPLDGMDFRQIVVSLSF